MCVCLLCYIYLDIHLGAIWLNHFATVLFSVCNAVTAKCCVLYSVMLIIKEVYLCSIQCVNYLTMLFCLFKAVDKLVWG